MVNAFARHVQATHRAHPHLYGPALFKAASKTYKRGGRLEARDYRPLAQRFAGRVGGGMSVRKMIGKLRPF